MKKILLMTICTCILSTVSAAYNVRQPSDYLRPTYSAADTAPGVWSLNVDDVLSKAKAAGKYTILLNTASWWCPFCETLEEMVLNSSVWKGYVAEKGYYLAMLDFPYRGHVKDEESSKSWHPELGDGWGFKCWLMCPEYLAAEGLTEAQGLDAIMAEYERQKQLALPTATEVKIQRWDTKETFKYGKLGYPTILVFNPEGAEVGRMSFPWYSKDSITASEAQEYVLQGIERIISGDCVLCEDPTSGTPDVSRAQTYRGWITDEKGAMAGTLTVKTGRYKSASSTIKISVSVIMNGQRVVFPSTDASVEGCIPCGDYIDIRNFTVSKDALTATLGLGERGITGSVADGGVSYTVTGALDVFATKSESAQNLAAIMPVGVWGLVVENTSKGEIPATAKGYGSLSLKTMKSGKVSITGYLGDGTKVSSSSQAIIGENGLVSVPVLVNMKSRREGLGFVVWFKDGKILSVEEVSNWTCKKEGGFDLPVKVSYTMSAGIGNVPPEMDLSIAGFTGKTLVGGLTLDEDPSIDVVEVAGKKWKSSGASGFSAVCNLNTCKLSGKMVFRAHKDNGREKKISCNFYGIVTGGSGYGTVVMKGAGAWPVKIAVCGACSD